jgi:hypothetical protein
VAAADDDDIEVAGPPAGHRWAGVALAVPEFGGGLHLRGDELLDTVSVSSPVGPRPGVTTPVCRLG